MDEALIFFDNKGWSYWRIEQGVKRLDSHDGEDLATAKDALVKHLSLLTPGAYTLKVRPTIKADNGQAQIDFVITRSAKINTNAMNTQTQQSVAEQIAAARAEGIAEGEKKATIEFRLKALEDSVNDLRVQLAKLFNDDEDDDKPAIAKISEIAAHMPNMMAGLSALMPKK